MIPFQLLLILFAALFRSEIVAGAFTLEGNDTSWYNRPEVHYTPDIGWMNDPNGLFYDATAKLYHIYYQFNPNDTIAGQPLYWGHATSPDLTHWVDHGAVIGPKQNKAGIFSGSIVVDHDNTSGLFNSSIDPNQRVVAIYTYSDPYQTQELAYSLDAGYTFIKYEGNPVIDIGALHFRDPKVFWHNETNQWIMTVSESKQYKILIYGSVDLINWALHSSFSAGYYGNQYECPGLIQVPIVGTNQTKWVMFLAINPGSPLGGSINEYFVGDFDGFEFKPDDEQSRFVDLGKDFYALQTFSNLPESDGVLAIAWASNWLYAGKAPTYPWRGSMSLPRQYTLDGVKLNNETVGLTLILTPILRNATTLDTFEITNHNLTESSPVVTNFTELHDATGLMDIELEFTVINSNLTIRDPTTFQIEFVSQGNSSEDIDMITLGYDLISTSYYMDRACPADAFLQNPYFTDKFSIHMEPDSLDDDGNQKFHLYCIVDRNVIESFYNHGLFAITNSFFMREGKLPLEIRITTHAVDAFIEVNNATIRHLSK